MLQYILGVDSLIKPRWRSVADALEVFAAHLSQNLLEVVAALLGRHQGVASIMSLTNATHFILLDLPQAAVEIGLVPKHDMDDIFRAVALHLLAN